MSTRLQVRLADAEMRDVRRLAQREGLTVGEWVRRTLRAALRRQSPKSQREKWRCCGKWVNWRCPLATFSRCWRRPSGDGGLIFLDANVPMYLEG